MQIIIEQATHDDVKSISTIAQLTFSLAGPKDSCPLEIAKYSQNNLNEAVFQQLINAENVFVACAHTQGEVAGFIVLKYNREQLTNEKTTSSAELQRLYVLKKYHGTHVAISLVLEVFNQCKKKAIDNIWLNVYSENNSAQTFYAKFGFKKSGTTEFQMGAETHLDYVMTAKIA